MSAITQPGTIVHFTTSTGGIKPGMLVSLHNPLTQTWDLVSFGFSGTVFVGGVHLNVPNDETGAMHNSFKVLSGSVPF